MKKMMIRMIMIGKWGGDDGDDNIGSIPCFDAK